MMKKSTIANVILFIITCYFISPWFFEKHLLLNELLSLTGLLVLASKGFKIEYNNISTYVVFLMAWGCIHAIVSLFRMDYFYYLLRNFVIIYSMLTFFLGYYIYNYLPNYIQKARKALQWYIWIFVFIPLPRGLFDRYGISMLFPALFKKAGKSILFMLILLNFIYAVSHKSSTAGILGCFYIFLAIMPGYRFFKQAVVVIGLSFALLFIYLQPNLTLMSKSKVVGGDIYYVTSSHPILNADGNNTWRLVLWNQIIVNHFPANILGIGFGTPMFRYFPVEDYTKVSTLPYILGGHNSYIYLFGRLGIVFLIILLLIYRTVFKEYFNHKQYYYETNNILIFWSFFGITIIALFNVVLESPIYSGAYWLLLGLVAKCIRNRQTLTTIKNENPIHP